MKDDGCGVRRMCASSYLRLMEAKGCVFGRRCAKLSIVNPRTTTPG